MSCRRKVRRSKLRPGHSTSSRYAFRHILRIPAVHSKPDESLLPRSPNTARHNIYYAHANPNGVPIAMLSTLNQYRPSKDSKQLLAKLTFVPRASALESSGHDAFRGFYTLFWISVGILMIRTYVTSFDQTGYPLSLSFAALFSKDALTLALSDGVLVASTALSVPFVKLMVDGYIPYATLGVAIQHLYQGLMLGVAVKWTFDRLVHTL